MSLSGRVAFVTGASRGIGRASAQALAEEGLRVAIGFREDKDSAAAAAQREKLIERIPMGRTGSPEEVAEAVRFCVRASYMTGATVTVDGGLS